jgi:NADPH:quinone reductase-like Zn-dependent oxidoreductase
MAGEVLAVGEDVTDWKVGDRVCPNFSPGLLYGVFPTEKGHYAALGAQSDGVLTKYKVFKSNVRSQGLP